MVRSVYFAVSRVMPYPAVAVWRLMSHWPAHARWVPWTTITVDPLTKPGVGQRFTARTGIGRLGFDDIMVVTRWQPPTGHESGVVEVRKEGRVVLGTASFAVRPLDDDRCLVTWTEDVDLVLSAPRPLGNASGLAPVRLSRPMASLARAIARAGFARALRAVERDLKRSEVAPTG